MNTTEPNQPKRSGALIVAALLMMTALAAMAPAFVLSAAAAESDFDFDLAPFEQRGVLARGDWDVNGASVTQTVAGQDQTFFVTDGSQVGGPNYRGVIFAGDIETPTTNNNPIGFVLGFHNPTANGAITHNTWVLSWKSQTQTAFGYTAQEGWTLFRVNGDLAVDDTTERFACFWGNVDADCGATVTLAATHHIPGSGWLPGEDYSIEIEYRQNRVVVSVSGGQYATPEDVIDTAGNFANGRFGFYSFRQPGVTFSDWGFRDEIAPNLGIQEQNKVFGNNDWIIDPDYKFRVNPLSDEGSGLASVECTLNGAAFACPTGSFASLPPAPIGDNVFVVTAIDNSGNQAQETLAYKFDPDRADQGVTWDCVDGNVFSSFCGGPDATSLVATPFINPGPSGVVSETCLLRETPPGGPTGTFEEQDDCSALTFADEGTYSVRIRTETGAGLTRQTTSTFTLDRTSPLTPVSVAPCADRFDAADFTACSDAVSATGDVLHPGFGAPLLASSIACTFDNAPFACGDVVGSAAHGVYHLVLAGSDRVGNSAERNYTLVVDHQPPVVTPNPRCSIFLTPEGWCRTEVELGAVATAISGIQSVECEYRTGAAPYAPVPCGTIVTADGIYDLRVRATSNVNRVSAWAETTFRLDTTLPEGFFVERSDGCSYVLNSQVCGLPVAFAYGEVPIEFFAEDPETNGVASGIRHVEFRDAGYVIERFTPDQSDNGFYRFVWDTSKAPAPGLNYYGDRTLEAWVQDKAGNTHIESLTLFVPLPPTPL